MCGINGIVSLRTIDNIDSRIQAMNKSLVHRGPDAGGIACPVEKKVALGHRRLSILDLDVRSNQPMYSSDGKYLIVFNGEIFNYLDIRQQLVSDYSFKTQSDTEVLLAAIATRGIEWALDHANGMFAFAFYEISSGRIFLARDRFGIKPLFYALLDGLLIFSSEVKGILSSGLLQPSFKEISIDDYLGCRYVREPYTFFNEIFVVRSSCYLEITSDLLIKEHCYWQLPNMNFDSQYDEEEVIDKTHHEVLSAMKRWFVSDVRVGTYLSGGLDSSLTTAVLTEHLGCPVDSYTIGFEDSKYNEFEYARMVANQYGSHHNELYCSQSDYMRDWDLLIEYKDAPLSVPNEIPLAQMSTALRKDMTVVISGEGADELFGGYGRIFRSAFDYCNCDQSSHLSFYDYFVNQYDYVNRTIRDKYLNVDAKSLREDFDHQIQSDFANHNNEENIFRFFHHYHIQGLLSRVDMTTMQTSVEARPPFLDHKLIEYVYQNVPYDMKLHWNSSEAKHKAATMSSGQYSELLDCPKYVLKRVAERYLPREVIYRKKMGFPVPLSIWFPNLESLSNDILPEADWLNGAHFRELILELKKNERSGQLLWMFINIQLFYNKYFKTNWKW